MSGKLSLLKARVKAFPIEGAYRSLAFVSRAFPKARGLERGLTITRNVSYGALPENRLDVYQPDASVFPPGPAGWPALLYVHGGAFRILSKDTHWLLAALLASRGYCVFNIDYRLAPMTRFPGAIEDACAAYAWVCDNAARYRADVQRLVVAGESAGANLIFGATIAAAYPRSEPFATRVFERGIVPKVALPACGLFQVSDSARFRRRKPHLPPYMSDLVGAAERDYLLPGAIASGVNLDFADPVSFLERGEAPSRPLPATFLPVGTRDPVLDDTRRMGKALDALGAPCVVRYYPGEVHAFHALLFREQARECWKHTFEFLREHLPGAPPPPPQAPRP